MVGQRNPDRQLREARVAYIGAAGRFQRALTAFDNSGMPMDPGPDPEPRPWTAEQIATLLDLRDALAEVIDTRRTWDGMRREWRPVH